MKIDGHVPAPLFYQQRHKQVKLIPSENEAFTGLELQKVRNRYLINGLIVNRLSSNTRMDYESFLHGLLIHVRTYFANS